MLKHTSIVKKAVYFWQNSPSFSEAIENVDFDTPGEVETIDGGWTILMMNIRRLPQEEHVYKVKRGESVCNLLMRLEQKNAACMKDIVQKFTNPGDLVVDACVEMFSVTRACMPILKHRNLMGF